VYNAWKTMEGVVRATEKGQNRRSAEDFDNEESVPGDVPVECPDCFLNPSNQVHPLSTITTLEYRNRHFAICQTRVPCCHR